MTRTEAETTLIRMSQDLAQRGWLRATSGNLSVRDQATGHAYITRSGSDKQQLTADDILTLSPDGDILAGTGKPSLETAVHQAVYRATDAGAVFHVHTIYNNVISRFTDGSGITFSDHEMLKALGHWDEGGRLTLPMVPNIADIKRLAHVVEDVLDPTVPAVLVERHGIYVFGQTPSDALRHLEAFEFLFEWLYRDRLAAHVRIPV